MGKKNFDKIKLGILVGVAIVIGTFGVVFVLRPSLEKFRIAKGEALELEQTYQTLAKRYEQASIVEKQSDVVAPAEIEKINALFMSDPKAPTIITLLARRATDSMLLLSSVGIGEDEKNAKGSLKEVHIQAQFKGAKYQQLRELLRLVTRSVPLLDVESFTFSPESAAITMNLVAKQIRESSDVPRAIDTAFLSNTKFKSLADPLPLPEVDPVGRANPFADIVVEEEQSNQ